MNDARNDAQAAKQQVDAQVNSATLANKHSKWRQKDGTQQQEAVAHFVLLSSMDWD